MNRSRFAGIVPLTSDAHTWLFIMFFVALAVIAFTIIEARFLEPRRRAKAGRDLIDR